MVMSEKDVAWRKASKGRGLRWCILRDCVAILSLKALSLMHTQDLMLKLRGLTRNKVVELLDDLERARAIKQVSGSIQGITMHGWAATDEGVFYWLGSRKDIPAHIAQVVSTLELAQQYERDPRVDPYKETKIVKS